MKFSIFTLLFTSFTALVSAHVQVWFPPWRDNSFLPPFSQTIYPCAGISDNSTTVRTPWPLTGGSLNITLHDGAAYIFVNIGLGINATNFNYTLFSEPLNETGAGNLCLPHLALPSNLQVQEGTNATLQVATAGHNGEGLYNCADITFTANATLLPSDQCMNSSTVTITPFGSLAATSTNSSSGSSTGSSSAAAASTSKSAGFKDFVAPSGFVVILLGLASAAF